MKNLAFVMMGLIILGSGCLDSILGSKDDVICNSPYMRVGAECCLDSDANSICDKDEKTVATTVQQATTTIQKDITCSKDEDCELPPIKIICEGDQVIKLYNTVKCVNPGKPESRCDLSLKTTKLETCTQEQMCYYGVCADKDVIESIVQDQASTTAQVTTTLASQNPTTTLAAEPTTTLAGEPTTTLAAAPDDESTSTLASVTTTTLSSIPCGAIKAWSQSQCDMRRCSFGSTCDFQANINPLLPGSCTCKSRLTPVTTTLRFVPAATITLVRQTTTTTHPYIPTTTSTHPILPCNLGASTDQGMCSERSCQPGKSCTYNPPSAPGLFGSCSCKAAQTTTTTLTGGLQGSFVLPTTTLKVAGTFQIITQTPLTTIVAPTMVKVTTTLPRYF